jgi:hypothetical protein
MVVSVQQPSPAQEANGSAVPADGRVIGTVVDEKTGTPLAGALVMLSDGRATETDTAGRFVFFHVRPGAHEISAVASGCAQAAGGFNVISGRDALLRLEVMPPVLPPTKDPGSGTASRVITAAQLSDVGTRSALDALMMHYSNNFDVQGARLVLRTRGGALSFDQIVEPLLVLDGVRMDGMVAQILEDMRAAEVERIEVHLGSAAGWEFQPGGALAVVEVTTRKGNTLVPEQNPERCVNWKGR